MCFKPSPVRRVQSPNRYMEVARFCFCKNNKRTIDRCRRQDVSREKKSFSLTMGIPSSFLMGVSAIGVRQRRQFRVGNDLVQCDVDTVRYSLFNFGVNEFISGVNMYNLGVKVQPRCEPSNTC